MGTEKTVALSFEDVTRQNIHRKDVIPFSAGNTKSGTLDNVGYLAMILLRVSGTLKATHASKTTFVKAEKAPWNIVSKIRTTINGNIDIANVSGYGLYLLNVINTLNYNLDQIVSGSDVFQFGNTVSAAGTNNNIDFTLMLPVKINDRDNLGIFLMQAREMIANITIDWADPKALCTDTDVSMEFTGNVYPTVEWFTVPKDPTQQPPGGWAHCIWEDQTTIDSTGENSYPHARGGLYRRAIFIPVLNGVHAANADIDRFEFWLNTSHNHYNVYAKDLRVLNRRRYGRDLPKGVYVWDWAYQGIPNLGSHRDYIPSKNFTKMESKLYISGSASLGTNNNFLNVIRETLVKLEKRTA